MTVAELYNSVAELGFEDSLESNSRFVYAANRALLQVNALRPATSSYIINHKPMPNALTDASFEPIAKYNDISYIANRAKAYYFECDGIGTVYFEREVLGDWVEFNHIELTDSKGFKAYRGFIKDSIGNFVDEPVRIRFAGEYVYSVRSVAMYEYLYSPNFEDIPANEAFTRYDIKELTTDFLSLSAPLIVEGADFTRLTQGYDIEDGHIVLLPYNAQGLFRVTYNRIPTIIKDEGESAKDDSVIDLAEDLCALLPVLIASYILVDDDPEKAQYYLSLYQERAIDIERRNRNAVPVSIISSNGW